MAAGEVKASTEIHVSVLQKCVGTDLRASIQSAWGPIWDSIVMDFRIFVCMKFHRLRATSLDQKSFMFDTHLMS